MKYIPLLFLILLTNSFAHVGGLDKHGGHNDRKNGGYHCHKEPCLSQHKQSEDAFKEAAQEKRQFSYIYNRKDWKHWSDFDNDCMNTRHEILLAQSDGPVKLSPDGCYVSKGVWHDPFSGKTYTRASDLDVDHIIPLKWAHSHGGANWSKEKKERFANDPINLLAVDDALNQAKGAKGPSEWMPPNRLFKCRYLSLWAAAINKYSSLRMPYEEARSFRNQLETCEKKSGAW